MWVPFLWFIGSLVLSLALAPKPPRPRAAALEDFDLPLAEEDRPIPVLFGTWRITGPNVVWYGNLRTSRIKKSSLFGSQTIGYKYYLGIHMALGHGPFDAITRIETADKIAWVGSVTSNDTISIDQPDLYGGKQREGGISGTARIRFGEPTQPVDSYLQEQQGEPTPAYRGVTTIVWDGYIGNTPYVKPWAVTARRILKGWKDDSPWYPEKAEIGTNGDMNPAHILYQCLTDDEWGMGAPPDSSIDDEAWKAAADTLYEEGFGISVLWNQQTEIQDFVGIILDHIAGVIVVDQTTGKLVLRLIRGDYDANDLPIFDPSNIKEVQNFDRRSWGETVNELVITFTDAATRKPSPMIVQDLGNIASQQDQRITERLSFVGISNPELKKTVAGRELAARSTPLARMDLIVDRTLWRYSPGDVIKVRWPEYDLPLTVMRILKVSRGTLRNGYMRASVVEDIYALSGIEYVESQPDADDPTVPDTPEDATSSPSVLANNVSSPPVDPADGDRYYIPTSPAATGDWAGHEGQIAEWDDEEDEWEFTDVPAGTLIYDESSGQHFTVDAHGNIDPPPWTPAIQPLDEVGEDPDLGNLYLAVYDADQEVYRKIAADEVGGSNGGSTVSPLTTKGDLYTHDGSANARLPVGSNSQVLTADATATTGVRWKTRYFLEPVANGDSDDPEMVFSDGDIVTVPVELE